MPRTSGSKLAQGVLAEQLVLLQHQLAARGPWRRWWRSGRARRASSSPRSGAGVCRIRCSHQPASSSGLFAASVTWAKLCISLSNEAMAAASRRSARAAA